MSNNRYGNSFLKGALAGIPFGIGLATGMEPTKEGVSDFIAQNFCSATQGWGTGLDCSLFFLAMIVIPIIITGWHLYTDLFEAHYDKFVTFLMYLSGGMMTTVIVFISISK